MSFTVSQHEDGYEVSRDSTSCQFYVFGDTDDPIGAYGALQGAISYVLTNGHWLQGIEVGPLIGKQGSKFVWNPTVTWGVSSSANTTLDPTSSPTIRFSTKGGRQHITQSRSTTRYSRPSPYGPPTPDHKGAIGVTPSGVQGCDIVVPAFSWSYAIRVPASSVSDAYISMLRDMTGGVNDDVFKGQPAGSVRFDGVDGQRRGNEMDLEFSFSGERNVEDQTIGTIEDIDKEGFDFLWVQYEDEEDTDAKALRKSPVGVYVEEVSPRVDMSLLGI